MCCSGDVLTGCMLPAVCRVHVPFVHEDMSSPRVLTMEFIDGVQVTDKDGLQVSSWGFF